MKWLIIILSFSTVYSQTYNGFKLSNLKITKDEIRHGGPPRDGIPSIDKPKFVAAKNATFLAEKDLVIGLKINGVSKAYPIKILNWHEIVNDEIAGRPIVITYCPLCRSAMVFDASVKGKELEFGVSGLLYNSDVLLYDRQTESLWSQLERRAVSGEFSGAILKLIPSDLVIWAEWRKTNPETLVLSTNTGHFRNYDYSPYGNYEKSSILMFPVENKDDRLHNKELVVGLELEGQAIAFPFIELRKTQGILKYREIVISFNEKEKTATVRTKDGKPFPSVVLYWFAWYAFHPDTVVYTH